MGEMCSCSKNQTFQRVPSNLNNIAGASGYRNSINRIIDQNTGEREIHLAVRNENATYISFLIENGCDINTQASKTKNTPLHIASLINSTKMVQLLLSSKADPNIPNLDNNLPIDLCGDKIKLIYKKHEQKRQKRRHKIKKRRTHKLKRNVFSTNSNSNANANSNANSNIFNVKKESKSLEEASVKSIQINPKANGESVLLNRMAQSEQFHQNDTDREQSPSPAPGPSATMNIMSASSMGITSIDPVGGASTNVLSATSTLGITSLNIGSGTSMPTSPPFTSATVTTTASVQYKLQAMEAIQEENMDFIGEGHFRGQKSIDLIQDESKFVVLIDSDHEREPEKKGFI